MTLRWTMGVALVAFGGATASAETAIESAFDYQLICCEETTGCCDEPSCGCDDGCGDACATDCGCEPF